jgi:chromosome segregation ATPase
MVTGGDTSLGQRVEPNEQAPRPANATGNAMGVVFPLPSRGGAPDLKRQIEPLFGVSALGDDVLERLMQRHQEQNESIRDLCMQVVEKEGQIEDLTKQLEEANAALALAQGEVERFAAELSAAQSNSADPEEITSLEEAVRELTEQNVEISAELETLRASAAESAEKAAKYEEMMGRLKEML